VGVYEVVGVCVTGVVAGVADSGPAPGAGEAWLIVVDVREERCETVKNGVRLVPCSLASLGKLRVDKNSNFGAGSKFEFVKGEGLRAVEDSSGIVLCSAL
jgi:hypothetical protein